MLRLAVGVYLLRSCRLERCHPELVELRYCQVMARPSGSKAFRVLVCWQFHWDQTMRMFFMVILVVACCSPSVAQPIDEGWRWADRVRVEYPSNVFSVKLGKTDRYAGEKFGSADGRSSLSIYSFANDRQERPADYLNRTLVVNPHSVIYKRVTARFFVISDIRNENVYYSRCNFGRLVRCVFLEYPVAEKPRWDRAVTRISHSLN